MTLREQVREILDAHLEEVERQDRRLIPGLWIFRRRPDHEHFATMIETLVERAREEGRQAGVASMSERVEWECVCRCKEHRRVACPLCLNVYGCPVHAEADPRVLRPEVLADPLTLAKALWATLADLVPDWVSLPSAWSSVPPLVQDAFVEALRRVVCVRFKARR